MWNRFSARRAIVRATALCLAAGLLAAVLVNEPITPNLALGLIAVFAGIWIATTQSTTQATATKQTRV